MCRRGRCNVPVAALAAALAAASFAARCHRWTVGSRRREGFSAGAAAMLRPPRLRRLFGTFGCGFQYFSPPPPLRRRRRRFEPAQPVQPSHQPRERVERQDEQDEVRQRQLGEERPRFGGAAHTLLLLLAHVDVAFVVVIGHAVFFIQTFKKAMELLWLFYWSFTTVRRCANPNLPILHRH